MDSTKGLLAGPQGRVMRSCVITKSGHPHTVYVAAGDHECRECWSATRGSRMSSQVPTTSSHPRFIRPAWLVIALPFLSDSRRSACTDTSAVDFTFFSFAQRSTSIERLPYPQIGQSRPCPLTPVSTAEYASCHNTYRNEENLCRPTSYSRRLLRATPRHGRDKKQLQWCFCDDEGGCPTRTTDAHVGTMHVLHVRRESRMYLSSFHHAATLTSCIRKTKKPKVQKSNKCCF